MEQSQQDIQIRHASDRDISTLCRLWQNLEDEKTIYPFGGDCPHATATRIDELVSFSVRSEQAIAIVAEDHSLNKHTATTIGTVAASLYDKPTVLLPRVAVVYSLWVAPEYRRHGIATRLIRYLETELVNMGAQSLQVAWDSPNTAAAALWQQQGYNPYEVIASKNLTIPEEHD